MPEIIKQIEEIPEVISIDYPEYPFGITRVLKFGLNNLIKSINSKLNTRFQGSDNIPQLTEIRTGKIITPDNCCMSIEYKADKTRRVTTFPAEYEWGFMFDITTILKNVGDNSPEAFELAKQTIQAGLMYFFTSAEGQDIIFSTTLWGNAKIMYFDVLGGEDEELEKWKDQETTVRRYVTGIEIRVSVAETTS